MKNQNAAKLTTQFGPQISLRGRLLRRFIQLATHLLFKVEILGADNVPSGNYIVVANHLSWIDHLLLLFVLPPAPRLYLVGAAQAINKPWKVWLMETFGGIIPFERGANWVGRETLTRPLEVLESGASLLLFPEGDVGLNEGELLPLKRGVGHFITRAPANIPILPIALSGVKELYWRKPIRVIIGEPFQIARAGTSHRAVINNTVAQVTRNLRALLSCYEEPVVAKKHLLFLTDPWS